MDKQKLYEELLKKKGLHVPQGVELARRNDPPPYRLSFAQRRIWFLQQFDPQGAAYNDPTAMRFQGPLNIPVLEKTINEILRRHQVLRMVFPDRQGQPVQQPHENDSIRISVTQWVQEAGKTEEEQTREFVNRESAQPFDLSRDMPIRAAVLKIAEDDYALVVNIHHIVMDGWSKGIMLRELMDIYQAISEGKPTPYEPQPLQYTDYVYWLHEWMQGKRYEAQMAYWKEQLAGAPPILGLPTDYPRPAIPTGKGTLEAFSITGEKLGALNRVVRQEGVTQFMLFMAAYAILLSRYSGQEDILVGTPIAGRHRTELENLIGLFVNTLVIRTELTGEPTFKTLLGRVKAAALQAYSNQEIPFEKLVEELNPQRNLSVTPLYQVMFQLQNAPMPPAHLPGMTITPIRIDTGVSQVDLSLTMWPVEEIMEGTLEYSTDLFTAATIKRMIDHYQVILEGIAAGEDRPVSQMPLMREEEKKRVLEEWNDTAAGYPRELCINQLFEATVEKNPQEEAVIYAHRRLQYDRLNQQANRLAQRLQTMGVGPETLVGICMENSLESIVGVIGILKAGGAYIPMDPAYPEERLKAILKDARPPVLITQPHNRQRLAGNEGKILTLEEDNGTAEGQRVTNCINKAKPVNAACVIYTSGSTGEPKGIVMSHRNIVNLAYSFIRSYKPGPGDKILPLNSIASASFVGEILPILMAGGGIVLAEKEYFLEIRKLTELITTNGVTILSTVPSMIARVNALTWNPGRLRLLLSGGETLSAGDIDHLVETVTIVNGYGLTEGTICSTYIILNEPAAPGSTPQKKTVISVGKPIINTRVYILDRHMNPVPRGVAGEIYLGGDGITRGYLNNPGLTAERYLSWSDRSDQSDRSDSSDRANRSYILSRILKTGDIGSWQPGGTIKFLGRIDTQVQIHGYRVELSEIENQMGQHPGIQEAVVIDREVAPGDRRLVAYFVTAGERGEKRIPPGSDQLRDWLGKRIPGYMIPAVFEAVDIIPLTVNGKVDTGALPMPTWGRPGLAVDYKSPQTEIEKAIAVIWQEFLHLEKIGINDNFFDLGGHSLLLTQVHSRISEKHLNKKELTIVDLFRYPTIHTLAKYIGEEKKPPTADRYERIQTRAEKQRQVFRGRREIRRPG